MSTFLVSENMNHFMTICVSSWGNLLLADLSLFFNVYTAAFLVTSAAMVTGKQDYCKMVIPIGYHETKDQQTRDNLGSKHY